MSWLSQTLQWFAGGTNGYCNLRMCMRYDTFWITLTVTLDVAVALGYALIAFHWFKNQRTLPASPARNALGTMRNIFAFCGFCGYLFFPIKLFWPAWRLYDCFMVALVFYTWRYALNSKDLRVIYTAIGRSNKLAEDLAESREESKRKSFFLNAISHDLRTPLNGMLLQANLAEICSQSGDSAGVQKSLDDIKSGAQLTSQLLDGLLEYARLESSGERVEQQEFDLDELLQDVLNTHAAMAARKSLVMTTNVSTEVRICTDRLKLERILNNLLSNAIKFTNSGSVRIDAAPADASLEIHVTDTGIGISSDHRERLFDEFFQVQNHARDRSMGFGLGLAICRRLAVQLGGKLRVESTLGKGSRFSVILSDVITTGRTQSASQRSGASTQTVAVVTTSSAGGR